MSRWQRRIPTVDSKVFEGNAGSLLDTGVTTIEKAEDWIEGIAFNASILFLRNFCKCDGGPSLKIDVSRKRESFQRDQWRAREEISIRTVWDIH